MKTKQFIICTLLFAINTFANIDPPFIKVSENIHLLNEYLPGKCKEQFNTNKELRICEINKISGFFKILPHVKALQPNPTWENIFKRCKSDINLSSRMVDYQEIVTCLENAHGQTINRETSATIDTQILNTKELISYGAKFLYGANVEQDISFAAKLFIKASNEESKRVTYHLLSLKRFAESNNIDVTDPVFKQAFSILNDKIYDVASQKANIGDPKAAYLLARKAEAADDYKTANHWYEVAARQDHPSALNNLGVNYVKGNGVEKNEAKGIEYYQKAAKLGNSYAQQTLGNRYVSGRGVNKDINKGVNYYKQAIEQNHIKAAYELANIYRKGKLIAQDYNQAHKYYLIAANLNHIKAQSWIGYFYEYGYGLEKNHKNAYDWYLKAANQGNVFSQSRLGYFYQVGNGVEKNLNKSAVWFLKAADNGNSFSQRKLGYYYEFGKGVKQNLNTAFDWYLQAANNGDENAMYAIANFYWMGKGRKINKPQASIWYHKSADAGYANAQFWLGEMYARGDAVKANLKTACEWTLKASKNGHSEATKNHDRFCQ